MDWTYFYAEGMPFVKAYSWPHFAYLAACALLIALTVIFRKKLYAHRKGVAIAAAVISIFQQVVLLYGWNFAIAANYWEDGLPLHMCRVACISGVIFLFGKNHKVMDIMFSFGIFAMVSLFYPSGVYHFLHISGISYMINHILTVLIVLFAALCYDWRPSWKGFLRSVVAFTVFMPCAMIANAIIPKANYFYLTDRPFGFLMPIPLYIYAPFIYFFVIACFALIHFIVIELLKRFVKTKEKQELLV